MHELLYTLRRQAERTIIECDDLLKRWPNDARLAAERRRCALLAARYHALIERWELRYG